MKKILLGMFFCMVCLSGCGQTKYSDYEADDLVSEAVDAVVDSDDIYYQGHHVDSDNIVYYEYLIVHEKQGQIEQIANAVNEVLEAGTLSGKINIDCWITMPGGASRVVNIMNYSDSSLEEPDYVALQRLCISGREESIYTEPLTYIGLVDIKRLEISSRIQKKAETNKIDWYAYWPDLESVEVLSE